MTTNKPEVLDGALVRPGRIDLKLNFTKSNEKCIKEILEHYWSEEIDKSVDISSLDGSMTPAEIIDVCRKSDSLDTTIRKLLVVSEEFNDDGTSSASSES